MKKILEILLALYELPLNILLHVGNEKLERGILSQFMKKLATRYGYARVGYYPKKAEQLKAFHGTQAKFSDCAIVLQGPLIVDDDFTVETVKLYLSYYDGVHIIVSTWENCDPNVEDALNALNILLKKNKYPDINGVGNINYQLVTSLEGIKYAEQLGVKYVWKTRTDQRYYHPYALPCMKKLLSKDEERLVCLGGVRNSFANRFFQLSDFMAFGKTERIEMLFSCSHDEEDSRESKHTRKNQTDSLEKYNEYIREVNQAEIDGRNGVDPQYDEASLYYRNPEVSVFYNYYKSLYETEQAVNKTYKASYEEFLENDVIIVDADVLGFFWKKYELQFTAESYFERVGKLDSVRWWAERKL